MNRLQTRIKALIEAAGPIPVSEYMTLCLGDPENGYYTTRDPIGAAGDFVTAPEVSQMFGELIGVWCMAVHEAMGAPDAVHLVELGPGHGTLMADLLRAARIRPDFAAAAKVHLVETSPTLRARQAATLRGLAEPIWHERLDDVPDGPAIVIANEFFDALAIRQLVRTEDAWRERLVGLDQSGNLTFGLGAGKIDPALLPPELPQAKPGAVFELRRAGEAMMAALGECAVRFGGAVLVIDYGHTASGLGDTLQAVGKHARANVLERPGEVDMTAHVDFAALARAAKGAGATVEGPVNQGEFLIALGLLERAGALGAGRSKAEQDEITASVERLAGPDEMGTLFKVMAVTGGISVPGFARLSTGASL